MRTTDIGETVVFGHAFEVEMLRPAARDATAVYLTVASGTAVFVFLAGILFRQNAVPRLFAGETSTGGILLRRWKELSGIYLLMGGFLAALITLQGLADPSRDVGPVVFFPRTMANGSMAHTYWSVPFFLLLVTLFCIALLEKSARMNMPMLD